MGHITIIHLHERLLTYAVLYAAIPIELRVSYISHGATKVSTSLGIFPAHQEPGNSSLGISGASAYFCWT